MSLTADVLARWEIVVPPGQPVLSHAARELREHLQRALPAPASAAAPGRIELQAGAGSIDGFEVHAGDGRIVISGGNPRGTLNGVYWLLEELGFAWVEPGEAGIVQSPAAGLAPGSFRETPSFPRRTQILGQDAFHDDWLAWMEWASRNRLNCLFFHDTPPSRLERTGTRPASAVELAADGGSWLFERWDADGPAIVAAARERGLAIEFGGHHLPALLPRDLFGPHPEWFPLRGGKRDGRYNVCVSSAAGMEHVQQAAAAFVQRFAGADVYHFWGDDIRGGGWCECGPCSGLPPSDQALLATNAIAEAVALAAPAAKVAHLAYHDTVQPPLYAVPAENVVFLWAPRERCYAHSFADPACAHNQANYLEPFLGLLDLLGDEPGRLQVFEYYSDAILFKGLAPTHLSVLPADARAYAAAGAANLQNLMVGDRPWVGPPWHAWWMARCAWDASASPQAQLRRFCQAAFPSSASTMVSYYEGLESGYRALFDLGDLQQAPRGDVLDFSSEPAAALHQKANEALGGAAIIDRCRTLIRGTRARPGPEEDRLRREMAQFEIVRAVAGHLAERTGAWDSALAGWFDDARFRLRAAEAELANIERWDAEWNAPAFAVITAGMRRAMHHHIAAVRRLIPG